MAIEDFAACVAENTGLNISNQLTSIDPEHIKVVINWWNSQSDSTKSYLLFFAAALVAAIALLAPEVADAILAAVGGAAESASLQSVMKAMVQCYDKL